MLDIGRKLQDLREAHGLSQRALARRAGISNALISLIEKEKTSPSVASLKKILDSFPVELSDFFASRSDAPPKTGAPRK
ncbi:helix-turn-helix domain-containing protein (plasmid) [Azospirillum brasilense]|uniref:Helix-turn-helix domain-containing protein n=1 Tax=Azospirillum brasilense TaxID=192 RepID=A0A4D8RDB8_AZOBR|nr:helix-turn-helix domain-containing protein [Azospirillum brasilense]QCO19871.1 helix-turn-helix domain-containing protein [Azospirillum brasilense]